MSLDGLTLLAVVHELKQLIGGRIDKIIQPEPREIVLFLRAQGKNYKLLLSASCDAGRVQLINAPRENPLEPPAFLMLLRKRLTGARIVDIRQENIDRVVKIDIEGRSELGDVMMHTLIAEVMGKHSNLLLVNGEGRIVDAVHHVSLGESSVRAVLPGLEYQEPPKQEKKDPREAGEKDFYAALSLGGRVEKSLASMFFGLSIPMARAICERILGEDLQDSHLTEEDIRLLSKGLAMFYADVKKGAFEPCLLLDEQGEAVAYYPFLPRSNSAYIREFSSMSEALEEFYTSRAVSERKRTKVSTLTKLIQNNITRIEKKIALHEEAVSNEGEREKYQQLGDIITANMYRLKKGMKEADLLDYMQDPPAVVAVALDETLTPSQNAQRHYKKYQKMKQAAVVAQKMLQECYQERDYLLGQLDNLTKCTTFSELEELTEELMHLGYIKEPQKRGMKRQQKPSKPMHFISSDGADIYVGKNNRQNDELTFKMADKEHIWLHAKNIPGSHVILAVTGEPSNASLEEAALLAAYYSSARNSSLVPVDYTRKKYIKKPPKAMPGMVTYSTNNTVYITPAIERVKLIKSVQES